MSRKERVTDTLGPERLTDPDFVKREKFSVIIQGNLSHAYLGSNVVSTSVLISIALLSTGKSEDSLLVIYSTYYIRNVMVKK
jgi:hypothetical protein